MQKKRRKLFLEKLEERLVSANIEKRKAEIENNETYYHKHVIRAIEATGRAMKIKPIISQQLRKRGRC